MRTRLHHWCSISCSLPIRTRMLQKKKERKKERNVPNEEINARLMLIEFRGEPGKLVRVPEAH